MKVKIDGRSLGFRDVIAFKLSLDQCMVKKLSKNYWAEKKSFENYFINDISVKSIFFGISFCFEQKYLFTNGW